MGKLIKLINVSDVNNNKFYNMVENGDGTWTAEYGRVGTNGLKKKYSMSDWDKKYREKTSGKRGKEGTYTDVTHLRTVKEVTTPSGKPADILDIKDSKVKTFVQELQGYSNRSVQDNYIVTAQDVTQAQVDEAQRIIDNLVAKAILDAKTDPINADLLSLYQVIPRKMSNVKNHLISQSKLSSPNILQSLKDILGNEQMTLDVMAGQVTQISSVNQAATSVTKLDILGALGLVIEFATPNEIAMIKKLMGSNSNQFYQAFKVTNLKTQKKFDNFISKRPKKNKALLFHGSRNENWWSILGSGLVLRPTNAIITGKMFGMGTYFANKAQKSIGYSSYSGSYWAKGNASKAILALYDVHTGNQFDVLKRGCQYPSHTSWMSQLTEPKLKAYGDYDCLFAHGGADLRNDEIIVYNEDQSTVSYLIEIK